MKLGLGVFYRYFVNIINCLNGLIGPIFLSVVLFVIFLFIFFLVSWMKDVNSFPLTKILINTDRCYTTDDDIYKIILSLGSIGTFLTQDVNKIAVEISRLSWVKRVMVRKIWPNELMIRVMEYIPVANWNNLYMLDGDCKVFFLPDTKIDKQLFPMLYGPENSECDVLVHYHMFRDILKDSMLQLKAVKMNIIRSWQVMLQDNICLKLGKKDSVSRLKRFVDVYPVLLKESISDNKRIDYVDLRYDSGFAISWSPICIESNKK